MPAYEVKIEDSTGATLKNGHDVMTVFAEDGPDAIAAAGGQNDADGSWANATATEIAVGTDLSPVVDSQGITRNYVLKVDVRGGNGDVTIPAYFEYTCLAADSYADAFAAMVLLINAHASFANAGFAANLLTISNIGDDFGDHTVSASFEFGGVAIPSFLAAVTHEGIAGAVLSVATNATVEIPKVIGSYRQR